MIYERLKNFILLLPLWPLLFLSFCERYYENGDGVGNGINDEVNGAYERGWSAWGWFWIILIVMATALLIWWISSRGRPQQRGGGGTQK